MGVYALAWATVVLPLLGLLVSLLVETRRRIGQICVVFSGLGCIAAAVVLGVRLTHATGGAFESLVTFFALSPPEGTIFATRFEAQLGVHVDALSASAGLAVALAVVLVQVYALTALRGDESFRRFFWGSSVLGFAACGFVFSPNIFDSLVMWVIASASVYALSAATWSHPDAAAHARRVMLMLTASDVALTLGVLFTWIKFGVFASLQPAPSGQDLADPFSFGIISKAAGATLNGQVSGAGHRALIVIGIIFLVAALVRTAQFPFHLWLTETTAAGAPVVALAGAVVAPLGVYLLARIYPVLVEAPQVLTATAVAGAAGAVIAAVIGLAQRDLLRIGVFALVAQLGLALTALGTGGFSAGVFIACTSIFIGTLLLFVIGNLVRVYRTGNIHEMGGAWTRLPGTSRALGIWALLAGGLGLGAYDALAATFANAIPSGGSLNGTARVVIALLALAAAVTVALLAARVLVTIVSGEVPRRRGFQHERVADVAAQMRRPVTLAALAAVVLVLAGLPGLQPFQVGSLRIAGLTFSRFVFFGSHHQAVGLDPLALLLALAAVAVGVAAGFLLYAPEHRERTAALVARGAPVVRALNRGLYVERLAHRSGAPVLAAASLVAGFDDEVTVPLEESAVEAFAIGAAQIERARAAPLSRHIAAGVAVAAILVLLSVLAATGHLWVHTL